MSKQIFAAARFDFLGWLKPAVILSLVLLTISVASLATRGLNWGLDFTGGILVEVGYSQAADLAKIRSALAQNGFTDASVQNFGTASEVLVRLAPREGVSSAAISEQVLQALTSIGDQPQMRRVEFVGPQVGGELRDQGGLAVIYALFGILVYVWLRFEKKLAGGALLALMHDVVIALGACSLAFVSFDLSVLAAILAVIGYSLNDTIVVFDRMRENFRKVRKGTSKEIMNLSVNQTISRTVITSGTTLLALFSLFLLGGEVLRGFSFALIVGVVVGTYSSIYVASGSALLMGVSKQDLMPPEKEGEELDHIP